MTASKAITFHKKLQGKIAVVSQTRLTKTNLALAYTPGVAEAVRYIKKNPDTIYDLTIKHNTIAVITDGSAVLGLGNVGPEAALPVMEGKCAIFKEFAGLNAFPLCLHTQDPDEIINTVRHIAPVFGGINLEDIAAPQCFYIEHTLQDLGIPVIHDDQHGTAIAVLAGLINAVKVVGKKLPQCKIVIVGAGAAGTAITKLLHAYGCRDLLVVDSVGIISRKRKDLPPYKNDLGTLSTLSDLGDLQSAATNADILIGVSKKGLFTKKIIQSMNTQAVVFALANPDPEVLPEDAKKWGAPVVATGRSDYPNQVNNALVYPGLFKGLLTKRETVLTNGIKIKTAHAIASLVKHPTPTHILPPITNMRLVPTIVKAISG